MDKNWLPADNSKSSDCYNYKPVAIFTPLSAFWRLILRVSKKVLLTQRRELEADGLVLRQQTGGYPPRVSYTLMPKGASPTRLLGSLQDWGLAHQLEVHAQSVPAKPTEIAQ